MGREMKMIGRILNYIIINSVGSIGLNADTMHDCILTG